MEIKRDEVERIVGWAFYIDFPPGKINLKLWEPRAAHCTLLSAQHAANRHNKFWSLEI